jgi:hypothetical protein
MLWLVESRGLSDALWSGPRAVSVATDCDPNKNPQFADHGPSLRALWTDVSRSLSALIGAVSEQRRFDGDVPVRCSRIGTHLVGRLDKALRRRALHPRQAHVEASREAEGAPSGPRSISASTALFESFTFKG